MLLQPFVAALIALHAVSWTVIPALACAILMFLVRGPLTTLARQRWVWRDQRPETVTARHRLTLQMILLTPAGLWLAMIWPWWIVAAMGGAAALLTALAVWVTIRNRQRAIWFQALSAAGLAGSCVAACLAVTGRVPAWCWWWWGLHAVHFLAGILVVHVRLQARIDSRKSPGALAPAYREARREAVIVQSVIVAGSAVLIGLGLWWYAAAVLFSASVHWWELARAHRPESLSTPMNKVGQRALAVSVVFAVLLIFGVWL